MNSVNSRKLGISIVNIDFGMLMNENVKLNIDVVM